MFPKHHGPTTPNRVNFEFGICHVVMLETWGKPGNRETGKPRKPWKPGKPGKPRNKFGMIEIHCAVVEERLHLGSSLVSDF